MGAPPSARDGRLWTSLLARVRARRPVIVGYHGIADCDLRADPWRLQVSPARFRIQVERLVAAGFRFSTMSEAADEVSGPSPRPGLAVITFDDGLRNNYTTALPILSALGIRATVYVATDFIGAENPWIPPGSGGEMLDRTEIGALADAGWEIGAHTRSHADLAALDHRQCLAEVRGSQEVLQALLGTPVDTFAYPFGRYGSAALAAVRDCGMRAAVTTGSGGWERFELTRAMPSNGDPYPVVFLKLIDAYEPLLRFPPLRLARTASKRLRGGSSER